MWLNPARPTATKPHKIKTHHNVGGLPKDLNLRAGRTAALPVQGRGAGGGRGAGPAGRTGLAAALPRAGAGRALPGRGDPRTAGPPARGGCHLHRELIAAGLLHTRLAKGEWGISPGFCGAAAGALGGCDGRPAHLPGSGAPCAP